MLHLFRAFFWLELNLARKYRSAIVSQLLQFLVFIFIFARLPVTEHTDPFNGISYMHFILTGVVYQIFYEGIMNGPSSRLGELQLTGQLQVVLSAPYPRWMILLVSGSVSSIAGAFRAIIVLAAGSLMLGISLTVVSWPAIAAAIIYTFTLGVALALLNVGGALLWPRLNLTSFFSSLLLGLLSGVFIPIDRLPRVCQPIAMLNPLRWGLDVFRSGFGQHGLVTAWDWLSPAGVTLFMMLAAAFTYRAADQRLTRDNRYQNF